MNQPTLWPRSTRWLPDNASRAVSRERVRRADPNNFKKYSDYFFYLHIEPMTRLWHALGMLLGVTFFILLALNWSNWYWNVIFYILGVTFFYGTGALTHYIFDGGGAKSEFKYLIATTPTVIYINWLTLTLQYQKRLHRFIAEYPFTMTEYDLLPKDEWKRLR